jgi:hypothetical protein
VTLLEAGSGFEAESMTLPSAHGTVANDTTASAGKSLMIWSNGTATRQQSTSAGTLVVRARGAQCAGAPRIAGDRRRPGGAQH